MALTPVYKTIYGGKTYNLPKQTADLLAKPPQLAGGLQRASKVGNTQYFEQKSASPPPTSPPITQMPNLSLPQMPQATTVEQDIAEEKKIQDLLQPRYQGMIDSINQAYLQPIREAQERAKQQTARAGAMAQAAGLGGSPVGEAQIRQAEKAGEENLQNIYAEKNLKIQQIFGDMQKDATERLKAKKAADLGMMDKVEEYRAKTLKTAQDRLSGLSSKGITYEDLKKSNPAFVNQLREDLGMSDLEIDAYLMRKSAGLKDWKIQQIGNKSYLVKVYDNGQIETSEFATDLEPQEELQIIDGVPYGKATENGKIVLRPVQGYTESAETRLNRQIKELQRDKLMSEIGTGGDQSKFANSAIDTATKALASAEKMAKYAGKPDIATGLYRWVTGSEDLSNLVAQSNTLRTSLLTLKTDPSIKKFFGPQMSNADVQLMLSAATPLDPENQSPAEFKKSLEDIKKGLEVLRQAGQNNQSSEQYVIGQIYENDNGEKAKYLGNGKWELQ